MVSGGAVGRLRFFPLGEVLLSRTVAIPACENTT